ncbi:hypothetical protein D046_4000B, partial [Vibrio parahaemolyticus V-223/04]
VASGSAAFNVAAMQSVGITSKPTPEHNTTLASFACDCSVCANSNTEISPVISR